MLDAAIYHTSHTRFHISSFFYSAFGLKTSFLIIFQKLYMVFMSGKFPDHSGTGIPLHSRNVLVLLE